MLLFIKEFSRCDLLFPFFRFRYLLLGAGIAERDYDDRTVLHVAASHGNENVLKFLLQRWQESPGKNRTILVLIHCAWNTKIENDYYSYIASVIVNDSNDSSSRDGKSYQE